MPLVQLRPKRQLTLPAEIAKKLHLKVGDYMEITAEQNQITLVVKDVQDRRTKRSIVDMIGAAKGVFDSVEEVDDYIAQGRSE